MKLKPRMKWGDLAAQTLLTLVGVGSCVFGIYSSPPQTLHWLLTFIGGLTLASIGILGWYAKRIDLLVQGIGDRLNFDYTGSSEKNWEMAIDLVRNLDGGWEAFDTTSGENKEDFEWEVEQALIARGCHYERVYCGTLVRGDSDRTDAIWRSLMMILDRRVDEDRNKDGFRRAITEGKLKILHLDRSLEMDLLIASRLQSDEAHAMIGFATRSGYFSDTGYTSGLYSRNPSFARDLQKHFQAVLWERALQHVQEERRRKDERGRYCKCVDYFDDSLKSLAPV